MDDINGRLSCRVIIRELRLVQQVVLIAKQIVLLVAQEIVLV